jgi:hypothetical protein
MNFGDVGPIGTFPAAASFKRASRASLARTSFSPRDQPASEYSSTTTGIRFFVRDFIGYAEGYATHFWHAAKSTSRVLLNVPVEHVTMNNPVKGKRGWAIYFSVQFYPTPTLQA